MKAGNLNFLETSGLLQACNGTAFLPPEDEHSDARNMLRITM
jgi:hypothetical protein